MFDSKPFFQRCFRPVTRTLARADVSANQVTLAALALSLAVGAVVAWSPEAHWPLLLVPCVLVLRLACNHIDGMLAREHGTATPWGGVLNEIADTLCDAALYLPLAAVPGVSPWLVVPAVMLGIVVEMTGVTALVIGASRRQDGPLGKKPRGVVFGAVALALGLGVAPGAWLDAVLAGVSALSALTIARRMSQAVRQVS
ncbi:MAG: CDP-alcohol phosphatidyltransferase family protein [Alphaproteobacteria bacterium]